MKKLYILLILLFLSGALIKLRSQDLIWSREAEYGILEGSADINEACANASNGKFVRLYSDEANRLRFDDVIVEEAGTYKLTIDYYFNAEQPLEIQINGHSAGIFDFPLSIWCYEGKASVMEIAVDLKAGINTLTFKPANGENAPFLDKLELYRISPPQVNLSVSKTRLFPGMQAELIVQANDIVTSSKWLTLEVSGISSQDYILDKDTLVIESGSSSASAIITFSEPDIAHGTEVDIRINSTEENLTTGEQGAVQIRVVTHPEVIFVSSTTGNDMNSGTDISFPLRSLEKLSMLSLLPGDSVLFKAGDIFRGQLRINGSGDENANIYIGRYGEGDHPELNGAGAEGGDYASAVLIENEDHITLQNLTITNDRKISRPGESDEDAYGIQVLNSGDRIMEDFHFSDLIIREIFAVSAEGIEFNKLQTAGIQFRSLQNTVAGKEKNISDVIVEDCFISHTMKAGIWSRHNGGIAGVGNDSLNRNMNLIFKNNHFFETGGSGIILSRSFNCLLENNVFEYTGSDVDPRMAERGSGAWFWNCRNVLAQYNKSLHVRGPNDSYGMHIDFANENVFLQYNYSEDSQGGFVEILGDNKNSVYRFNISVNDGSRDRKGNSIWVSDYAGSGTSGIKSDNNYIYNNTIYVDKDITPDIMITGINTYIYNNIFYATGNATIGEKVELNTAASGSLNVSNNLFFGNVTTQFRVLDQSPVEGDPLLSDPGALISNGYMLNEGSIAMNAGLSFTEPVFPQSGKGIFKDIPPTPGEDYFGNPVSISTDAPSIGAFCGMPSALERIFPGDHKTLAYFDPLTDALIASWESEQEGEMHLSVVDISGRVLYSSEVSSVEGRNIKMIPLRSKELSRIVIVVFRNERNINTIKVPVL